MISLDVAWRLYIATRLHFLTAFDAKKSGVGYKNQKQIDSRPDKGLARTLIEGISTEREFVELCISNFLNEDDQFLYQNQGQKNHTRWKNYWELPVKNLKNDLSIIEMRMYQKECSFNEYMASHVSDDLLSCKIRRESICILEFCIPGISDKIEGLCADRIRTRIRKCIPLIEGRLKKIREELDLSEYEFLKEIA